MCKMILGTGGDRINKPSGLVLSFKVADFLVEREQRTCARKLIESWGENVAGLRLGSVWK